MAAVFILCYHDKSVHQRWLPPVTCRPDILFSRFLLPGIALAIMAFPVLPLSGAARPAFATSVQEAPGAKPPDWKKGMQDLIDMTKAAQQTQSQTQAPAQAKAQAALPSPAAPAGNSEDGKKRDLFFDRIFNTLTPDLQDELLDEAQQVYNECSQKMDYRDFHDCRCISSRFLETRLVQGPDRNRYDLLNEIRSQCADAPAIAGTSYDMCMNRLALLSPQTRHLRDKEIEDHCKCFARTMAKRYTAAPNPDYTYIALMRANVMDECYNRQPAVP